MNAPRNFRWMIIGDWIYWAVLVIVLLLTMVIFSIAAGDDLAGPMILLGPVFLFLIYFAWARALRRRRALVILGYLEDSTRLNLPLAQSVSAAASSERGTLRRRLRALASRLSGGQNLGAALYDVVPEVTASATRSISAAESIGRLPQAIRRIVHRASPQAHPATQANNFYRVYAVFVAFAIALVLTMILVVVMPKFNSIFKDFHAPLPWTTKTLEWICATPIPFIAMGVWVILICMPWTGPFGDAVLWYVPVLGSAARDRAKAELCAFLADAADAGLPMDRALADAAVDQPNAMLRWRIGKWSDRVASGESLVDGARHCGIPDLIVGMLKTVRAQDDLIQVMSFLARHYEYRLSRAQEVIRAASIPLFVAVVGAVVLATELSVMQALIGLTDAVASPMKHAGGF